MKHKLTYFTVAECRGACGYQTDRLTSCDNGKCENGVGFTTPAAAAAFIRKVADEWSKKIGIRKVKLVNAHGRAWEFIMTYEAPDLFDNWREVKRWFKIDRHEFGLFTEDEVATRNLMGY